jgi:phage-related protein
LRVFDLLEEFGPKLSRPYSKKVRKGLFELGISGKQEVRIFYTFYKGAGYLFYGFIKKSQKTPKKELHKPLKKLKLLDRI